MSYRHDFIYSLLELFYPEHCICCGEARGVKPWVPDGAQLYGLRHWDAPHLCEQCFSTMTDNHDPASSVLSLEQDCAVPILAAQWTNPQLVAMVGAWKYKGVRGLIWPLAELIIRAWDLSEPEGINTIWIPVPLHARRLRERGFNQARMLAAQLAAVYGGTVMPDLVCRRRFTGQQAKLTSSEERRKNIQGAFGVTRGLENQKIDSSCRIMIVDDLVTTGATVAALAEFLKPHGFDIDALVCLGAAKPDSSGC